MYTNTNDRLPGLMLMASRQGHSLISTHKLNIAESFQKQREGSPGRRMHSTPILIFDIVLMSSDLKISQLTGDEAV